jgi:hypothetical protein
LTDKAAPQTTCVLSLAQMTCESVIMHRFFKLVIDLKKSSLQQTVKPKLVSDQQPIQRVHHNIVNNCVTSAHGRTDA